MIQLDSINQRNNLDFCKLQYVTFTKTDGPTPGAEDNFGQLLWGTRWWKQLFSLSTRTVVSATTILSI